MSDLGLVHIVDMGGDSKSYPINGEGLTPRQVIADFFDYDPDSVDELLDEKTFRIVNRGQLRANGLDRNMPHGETITVYSNAVATGGVKGAMPRGVYDRSTRSNEGAPSRPVALATIEVEIEVDDLASFQTDYYPRACDELTAVGAIRRAELALPALPARTVSLSR